MAEPLPRTMDEAPPPDHTLDDAALTPPVATPARLEATHGTLSHRTATAGDEGSPAAHIGRYPVLGELGRGGMCVVLKSTDADLGRQLAIKMLLPKYRDQGHVRSRFLEEARITGQLEHPGIPPIHELGQTADGQPFFTMKLIKGRTLAELLAERLFPDLPRFLAIFEQIAQTLAYAHAHRVIHRDLKPSNVMVGRFGEVQVMDWGLAKVLGQTSEAVPRAQETASIIHTERQDGEQSQAGTILGTPAYMAPEQARGEIDSLDERCDVFGLGAILCEMLTSKPPFLGTETREIIRRAARGEVAGALARLDNCGADGEMIALASACLAAEPSDRPRDAAAVVQSVTAYRANVQERLRRAEIERAAAEARVEAESREREQAQARAEAEGRERVAAQAKARAERRARRLTLGLAAAALLVVLAGGGGAWFLQQQWAAAQAHQQQTERETRGVLQRGRSLLQDGWRRHDLAKLTEAKAEAERAADIARSGGAGAAVLEESAAFRTEASKYLAQAQKNRDLLLALLDVSAPKETDTYTRTESGQMAALAAPSVEEQYVAAFRRWGLKMETATDAEIVARLRDQPEVVVQELVASLDAWMLRRQKVSGGDWRRLFRLAEQLDRNERRRQLRALLADGAQIRVENVVGLLASSPPWPSLWEMTRGSAWRRLQALRGVMDPAKEPVLTIVLLAQVSRQLGDAAGAEQVLRQAIATHPDQVVLLHELGSLLDRQGRSRLGEAIERYSAARAVRPRLGIILAMALSAAGRTAEGEAVLRDLVQQQPDNPEMHFYLGNALSDQGKLPKAVAAYREAIRLKPEFPEAHYNLGNALQEQKNLPEAVAVLREAIRLKPDYPMAHNNLGNALQEQKKLSEAVAAYREAIRLKPDYPEAHNNLGSALRDQGKLSEAVAALREAIRLKPDEPQAHYNLGVALKSQGKLPEAVAAYREAIRLKPVYPEAHNNLGGALRDQGKLPEAVAALREAIRLKPDFPEAYCNLGVILNSQGKLPEAIAAWREAVRRKPDYPEAHCALGGALRQQGDLKAAQEAIRRGHELGLRQLGWTYPSAQWVKTIDRQVALEEKLPAFLRGDAKPAGVAELLELIEVCRLTRRYATAARFCADALALDETFLDGLRFFGHYKPAFYAALAAAGHGQDAPEDSTEARRLRRQTLDWLKSDLAAWTNLAENGKPADRAIVVLKMRHWQQDSDLSGVRHPWSLLRLSAEERKAWQKLWADVNELLRKASADAK